MLGGVLQRVVDRRLLVGRIERIEPGLLLELVAEPAAGIELERAARLAAVAGEVPQALGLRHLERDFRIDAVFPGGLANVVAEAARIVGSAPSVSDGRAYWRAMSHHPYAQLGRAAREIEDARVHRRRRWAWFLVIVLDVLPDIRGATGEPWNAWNCGTVACAPDISAVISLIGWVRG